MRYLLDSTVLIDHGNADPEAVRLVSRLFAEGHQLLTCDVVTCETLSLGADEHLTAVRGLLDALEYVATSPDAARRAGDMRLRLRRDGRRLALADALIGGVASSLSATVVTRNRPDFARQGVQVLTY